MSNYYVGPFGRILPVVDGTSAKQEPASIPISENFPYQLPPPRVSGPSQFGVEPFLHQQNLEDKRDSGMGQSSKVFGHKPITNEQLPSVSELLTPISRSRRLSSPYRPVRFGHYTPNNETRETQEASRQSSQYDPESATKIPLAGRLQDYTDSYSRPTPENLRPLSHMSIYSPGREVHGHPPAHVNSPAQSFLRDFLPSQGNLPYQKGHGRGISSSGATDTGITTDHKPRAARVRPHVVDERYIEGEGLCYIYADGSHCPKIIDGVQVNANWGVTKAGKPRKRLAQACLTCREKKIKCQPNLPKCDQCQKSGRECRFESASRGSQAALKPSHTGNRCDARENSASGTHNRIDSSNSIYSMVGTSDSSTSPPGTSSYSPRSDASVLSLIAVDNAQEDGMDPEQLYRIRRQSLGKVFSGAEDLPRRPMESTRAHVSADYADILMEMKDLDLQDPLVHDWHTDPYETNPELTTHYIETYFTCVNDSLYYMLPRRRFFTWLRSCRTKSLDDNMLLYSMMAMGSVFSDRLDRVNAMKRYSRTARYALEHNQHSLSLQLAQSRIIMSLWYYAIGALLKSWDAVGAAVRTVCALRYNVESGGVIMDQTRVCEYGLHPQALIECRRRTFWIAFLMDRLSCLYSPTSTFTSSQTTYLRLPCREEIYEAQQYTTVPYLQSILNQVSVSPEDDLSALSAMALLIEILTLWGDVSDHVFRLSSIPAEASTRSFEDFHATVIQRSDQWVARLPDHLRFTALNMERSIRAKNPDTLVSLHMLYHATLMKLYRYARFQNLRSEVVDRYIHTARSHAVEVLRISLSLMHYASEYETLELMSSEVTVLNPFLGYVILSAVDVLSAAGLIVDIPECVNLIKGGLETVRELSRFWGSVSSLASLIETRLRAMVEQLDSPAELEGKLAFFAQSASLDSRVYISSPNQDSFINEDLLYDGLPRDRLFSALGLRGVPFSQAKILLIREPN